MGGPHEQADVDEDYGIMLNLGRTRGGSSTNCLRGADVAALGRATGASEEVSSVNVAFFDEPTANLDDDRRENLAEQILRVKGWVLAVCL